MADWSLNQIVATYEGSNGDQTKALYAELETRGAIGFVALNLFRACKNSARAKVYRGGISGKGSFRRMAYDRKAWAIDNLANALRDHAEELGIRWGWGIDPDQSMHSDVLYVDLPNGQVSFHTGMRGSGPDYPGAWDGVRGQGPSRICAFCARVLEGVPA